jgi:hypothetical protein
MFRFGLPWIRNKFVINPGSGSGTLRLRRTVPLLFEAEKFKNSLFQFIYLKNQALKRTRSGCLRAI